MSSHLFSTPNQPLRIGFDVTQTGAKKTGCGFYAHAMLQAMMTLSPQTKFMLYPSFGDGFFDPFMPLTNPYPNGAYGPRHVTRHSAADYWNHSELERNLKNPDIIHANNFWCPTQLTNTRLVYTLHDLGFISNPGWTTELNRVSCFEGVFKASIQADWIVAVSKASRDHYLEVFPHFPSDRIEVVYPCSRYTNPSALGTKPKALGNLTEGEFWLSVGTIEPRKNQKRLAKAYADYLSAGGKPMPLVFAGGKGWLMDDFHQYIHELGISSSVIFTNYVSDDELIWLYRSCYAHIYPSMFEGFGLPVLEGMQFGAATLTSNTTSMPEIASKATILLSPNHSEAWTQAMLELANDPEKRNTLKQGAKQQAVSFSWQESANKLLNIYETAVSIPKRIYA